MAEEMTGIRINGTKMRFLIKIYTKTRRQNQK